MFQIYVPTNPRGAESLPPGIVVPQTDLFLRRLWGEPSEVCIVFICFVYVFAYSVIIAVRPRCFVIGILLCLTLCYFFFFFMVTVLDFCFNVPLSMFKVVYRTILVA